MINLEKLHEAVLDKLSTVIDPETGVDVVRMRLIEDLIVDDKGYVSYKFHPSSPFCPIAVPLSLEIQHAVAEVKGVTGQEVEIVGFAMGAELTAWLKLALEAMKSKKE